ncbi:Frag1/DRAM/Sfk1 family-domain-containing protein [Mycotypha africana]|uniref:Frag1/DRAM/Sfk1 family-domain-containing protein n=1 Tax=Mycotypha africana TaxID=64632 RepID=UPI002301893A|nr:Frag1/DRAM/Sfk1 family-domain-containing protein [Mycotypha africana]KAI8967547.1 Frag1/DRAM/Sfk1 family-domain-containing protein [Mycotypha africana]
MAEKSTVQSTTGPEPFIIKKIGAKYVAYAHTLCAYSAFFVALIVACYTHYYKIVQNEYFGYPDEWFPSVSATTGDRYPARAIFQILIALTSGPRFALLLLWFFYSTYSAKTVTKGYGLVLLIVGIIRTVACGGFVYITSTDDHLTHDIMMILYLLCTVPWQVGVLYATENPVAVRWRKFITTAFFTTLPPMIYFFIQHKVNRVPGAYTTYAFFEWSLILFDVAYDAVSAIEFQNFELSIVDKNGISPLAQSSSVPFVSNPEGNIAPSTLRTITTFVGFVTETYLAYIFWSMLTSLALLIWYFPLWYMGISGFEAFLFITLMPVILGITPLRRLIAKYRGIFHFISLIGIASYLKQDPVWRLSLTAAGIGLSATTWVATWLESKKHTGELERSVLIWSLGLVMHNVVKMAWFTENPIWPIMNKVNGGWNDIGIVLGIIASAEVLIRDGTVRKAIESGKGLGSLDYRVETKQFGSSLMAATGFGSLLFALHSMYTDSSTIMRWTVDGYPNHGPEPVPWGAVTISFLVVGLILSPYRRLTTSFIWYAVGCCACTAFYYFSAWTAYYAGLVLGAYLLSITPALVRGISTQSPLKSLFTAFMTYNILCLAHVWVVAYEFVPGGVYAREHTDIILATMMALIGLGVLNANQQAMLDVHNKLAQFHILKQARSMSRVFGVGFIAVSAVIAANRVARAKTPVPYTTSEKSFTAGIWTIHFALDNDMWASENRMRDAIRDLELDVVGLLESDTMRIIMGNRDWAQSIAEDLGYYLDYGPSSMKHTWGCLMLSKFPIIKSTHHLLPSPVGELACAIHATLDVYGQPVDFIVSHNGQDENYNDRIQQTTELARIMRTSPNPFVFLGYVVTKPKQEIYHLLFDGGDMNDIDPSDWDRWCQYIGYRGLRRVAYARVSHGRITDTEIQTGKFQVVSNPKEYWKASYNMIDESQVPEALRYPSMFRGSGTRGHRYHVFNEPRYFAN